MDPHRMIFALCEALDSLIPSGPQTKASSTNLPVGTPLPGKSSAPSYVLPPANVMVAVKHPGPAPDAVISDYERGYQAAEQQMKLERADRGKAPTERDDYLACTMLLQLVRDVRAAVEDGTLPWSAVDLSLPAAEGFLRERQARRSTEGTHGR